MQENQAPQFVIEEKMRSIAELGNYDMVHLFSSEGLPVAEYYAENVLEKDRLAELSLLFRDVRQMADVMGKISSIKEMVIEGYNRRKIVFRFFNAFGQDLILAIVVPPRKAYRGVTNSLIRVIEKASS